MILAKLRTCESRLSDVKASHSTQLSVKVEKIGKLACARSDNDLRDISLLPDCVKALQIQMSWVHSVEGIRKDFSKVRPKSLYRA